MSSLLQMFGGGEPRIRAFDAGLLIGALAIDPVAEIGVDQLLQRPPAFAVRRGEAVVVDQRMEAVAPPVPDVPDERTLMEQLAMLLEEPVAQPVIERLAGIRPDVRQKACELRRRPVCTEGVGGERVVARSLGGRFALNCGEAEYTVVVSMLWRPSRSIGGKSGKPGTRLSGPR